MPKAPLPLTVFEEYMLRDDRPTFPMSIVARLRFAGQLNRAAAADAWRQAVARHPLLRAVAVYRDKRRPVWSEANELPTLQWENTTGDGRLPQMRPIDLTREPGLRGWASSDARESTLVLQFHHAAADGKGTLQFIDDFLRGYARADGECGDIDMAGYDEDCLRQRGRFGLTAGKLLGMLPAQISGLVGAAKFLFHQPVPLLAGNGADLRLADCVPETFPAVRTGCLNAADLQKLSALAAEQRVTVNDWLLRDFFLAVDDFRRRHETPNTSDWIRISVPISLRRPSDARLSAANVVSMVFLDRTARQSANPSDLLQGIHEELALIRRRQLGLTFIWSLCAMRALPGGLARRVHNGRCEATCVVSNLGRALADSPLPRRGDMIVAGKLLLENVELFGPLREGTAATLGLVFYAGELQICLHYDVRRVTAIQADDLLRTYLQQIRESLGAGLATRGGKAA